MLWAREEEEEVVVEEEVERWDGWKGVGVMVVVFGVLVLILVAVAVPQPAVPFFTTELQLILFSPKTPVLPARSSSS